MAVIESVALDFERRQKRAERFRTWKFWLVAIILHLLFFVGLANYYVQILNISTDVLRGVNVGAGVAAAPPKPDIAQRPVVEQRDAIVQPKVDTAITTPALTNIDPVIPTSLPAYQPQAIEAPKDALPATEPNVAQWMARVANPEAKARIIRMGGGDPDIVEPAVLKALRWLKGSQNADGSWGDKHRVAMTGLALLAFLAHGETPASREFGLTVQRGINWLLAEAQRTNGRMGSGSSQPYEHGIGTYALAEAYGMTRDPKIQPVLEQCINTIIKHQTVGPEGKGGGGWVYGYRTNHPYGDLSISGWQVQALKTAHLSGILQKEIGACLDKAMQYVKRVYSPYRGAIDKGGFGYQQPGCSWTLTGTGLLCLQFWNEGRSEEAHDAARFLREEVVFLVGKPPQEVEDARAMGKLGGSNNLYAYYYITQSLFLYDAPNGPSWQNWNRQFIRPLISTQQPDGSFPIGDYAGHMGGADHPVYRTSLSVLMLTVYYRNLPSMRQWQDNLKVRAGR